MRLSVPLIAPTSLAGLLLCILLSGCAPDPVYRLQADAPDSTGFWQQGRQVVTYTIDSLQTAVAYARTTDEGHKFRLAFVNRSATPYTIAPTDVYAVVTKRLSDDRYAHLSRSTTDGRPRYVLRRDTLTVRDTLRARNPEQVLLRIDKAQAREAVQAETAAAANAFFLALDAVSEIASNPRSPDERTADATQSTAAELREAGARRQTRRTQARLSQQRARWARSALRRTTLAPGGRTTGFVYVPLDPKATEIVLHISFGPRAVLVPFRQQRYDP